MTGREPNIIIKNLQTFCAPYDRLDMEQVRRFLEKLQGYSALDNVNVTVTLKHPVLNITYLQAEFPAAIDVTHEMSWVVSNRPDAVAALAVKNGSDNLDGLNGHYQIGAGDFIIRVNKNLALKGVVENMPGPDGWGTLRRVRGGILFHKDACSDVRAIHRGSEASFIPLIVRTKGIQACCIEPI